MKSSYRDLNVWKDSVCFVTDIYRVTEVFPVAERYGLTSQLQRAAVSVPSNIAEGAGRLTKGEWRQSLSHARGSVFEIETQIEIACQLGYLPQDLSDELQSKLASIGRQLSALIRWVQNGR